VTSTLTNTASARGGATPAGESRGRDAADHALAAELGFDRYWIAALQALRQRHVTGDALLAPNDFLHFFDRIYPIHIRRRMIPGEQIDWFLLHKGMLERIDPAIAKETLGLTAHFANEVFVLYGRRDGQLPEAQKLHAEALVRWATDASPIEPDGHAALVKTFNRPLLLERSLASLAGQFDRILVIDDGSLTRTRGANRATAIRYGAQFIHLGRNRGAASAFNVGLAVLLAELDIAWISAFDDDVELAAGGVDRLRRVTRNLGPLARLNFYSGYASSHHRVHGERAIGGERVLICRSCSGQHMHAHRSYWEAVIPIPTAYAKAPKASGGIYAGHGDDTDWWCSNWAPNSAIKRGGSVYVVPGLVTTFGQDSSTWGGPGT
jgi:hypothetical protein